MITERVLGHPPLVPSDALPFSPAPAPTSKIAVQAPAAREAGSGDCIQ